MTAPNALAGGLARRRRKVLGAITAALLLAVSACGGEKGSDSRDAEEITDLVIDVQNEPDSLDPFYRNNEMAQRYYRLTYSSLLKWNEDGTFAPDLASELPEVSEDRLTYRIPLRDDVIFHDGSTFDAADVVHTYQEAVEVENGAVWRSGLAFVKTIEAEDDHMVVLTLTEPYAFMESRLALVPILSSDDDYQPNETYAQKENGTGPYVLDSFDRGKSLSMTRFADYYGEQPEFESITLALVPENPVRVARLTNGETHIVPELPPEQVEIVRDRGQEAETMDSNVSRIFFYTSQAEGRPTADSDFRVALAWAIDRQAIIDNVYKGAARPNSTYLTYGSLYHDEELGLHFGEEPDLAKAEELLAAAGGPPDRPLEIIVFDRPDLREVGQIVQANLKQIGIESEIEIADVAGFFEPLMTGNYDLLLYRSPATTSSGLAPDYVNGGLNSESANNFNKFADPEMDRLLHDALVAPEDEQAAAWKAVQQRDLETQGHIQLVIAQNSEGWASGLTGYQPSNFLWFNTLLMGD